MAGSSMINKKEILRTFKADLKAAETLRNDLDVKIQKWKDEYDGKPYGNEQKGKSQIVSRDIKRQNEWQHASLIDPFVSSSDIIKAIPVTYEDVEAAKQNELVLNTQFCRKFNRFNFMTKAIKVLGREGTAVIKTSWEYEDKEITSVVPNIVVNPMTGQLMEYGTKEITEIVVTKNQPNAEVCRNEDIFIDPTCMDDMDKCQFVVHRYETDYSTLKADGRYKNLEKIVKSSAGDALNDSDYDSEDETEFTFTDDPRKKMIVYEYWGNYDINNDGIVESIVCAWIGNEIIRLESNPYPDDKPPFLIVPLNSVPFQMHGEADAEYISDNQKIKTAITRGIIDNMAQSNNAQKGIKKGALDAINKRRFLSGQNFEFNGTKGDFFDGSYNQIPGSAFDMLALQNNEIESITATKSFSGGISGNSLGATATGVRGALDATSTRRLNVVRNIAENLIKPLMRKWMSYNSKFLEEEEVVRITNSEFVTVKRDDLDGRIDIDIEVSTAEDNAAKAQELSFMLQTGQQTMNPEEVRIIRAEIARLQKMPYLAKKIEEFRPEPDPLAIKKAELEIALLEAKVMNERAKGRENEVDVGLKKAKTASELAKTRNINSQSDKQDLEFLREESGAAKKEKMQEKYLDHKSKAELETIKQENNKL